MSSTAPAARQKVLDLLVAALPSSSVTWGQPTETEDVTTEVVYLGNGVSRTVDIRAMGAPVTTVGMVGEEYRFPVVAEGLLEGDDQRGAELRGWEIVAVIEQAIRSDLNLGGILNQGTTFGDQQVVTTSEAAGWIYQASVELICTAVI